MLAFGTKQAAQRYLQSGGIPHFTGKHHTPEAKEKNRMAHLGKGHTLAARLKISKGLRGHPVSEATRAKLRAAALRRANEYLGLQIPLPGEVTV